MNKSVFVLFSQTLPLSFWFWLWTAWVPVFLYIYLFLHVNDWLTWCFFRVYTNNIIKIWVNLRSILSIYCQIANLVRLSVIINNWIGFQPIWNVFFFDFLLNESSLIEINLSWFMFLFNFTLDMKLLSFPQHKLQILWIIIIFINIDMFFLVNWYLLSLMLITFS